MIIGIIHKGSGLGDQLFSYIATRVRAVDLGVEYGFVGKEFFKGAGFMNLDWGKDYLVGYHVEDSSGKVVVHDMATYEINKPYFDPDFMFIPNNSVIDGYGAQDIRYFEHRLDEVREWLKVEAPGKVPYENVEDDDICIINFRGGEYKSVADLYLTKEYWDKAINEIRQKYPKIVFKIHSDDPQITYDFFPKDWTRGLGIALNWRSIRYAKHLIISNSAFAILPALLNENVKEVIAPKYWAGRNVGEWRRPGNYYKKFLYV